MYTATEELVLIQKALHSRKEHRISKAHPNLYEFVEVILKEQTATEVFLTQLKAGACPLLTEAREPFNRDRKVKGRFETN